MTNNWLITGATSGFGRRVAERALQNGAHVIAVGRRAADLPARAGLTPLALDITAPEAEEVLRAAVDVAGGLDVLVNNAGYGLFGSVEQTRRPRSGPPSTQRVGQPGRAAGHPARPARLARPDRAGQLADRAVRVGVVGLYSASKAAVELLSEALAAELPRPACG
jgi:short-subunit dehydrogenase